MFKGIFYIIGGTPPDDSGLGTQSLISKLSKCDSEFPLTLEKLNSVIDNDKGQFIFSGKYIFTFPKKNASQI